MAPRRVAGLDLSLLQSGLARADATFLTIKPSPRSKDYRRHYDVAGRIVNLLLDEDVDLAVLEGYDPHPQGALALIRAAEIGGIVRTTLTHEDVPFVDVPPSSLKKYATGKGNAAKAKVFDAAKMQRGGDGVANYDEADAFWLRRGALEHYRTGAPVFTGVDWPTDKELVR